MTEPTERWVLELNAYQRDNLLWLLNAVGYPSPDAQGVAPFTLAHTGDWVGELVQMLAKTDGPVTTMVIDANDSPNMSHDELRKLVERWRAALQDCP